MVVEKGSSTGEEKGTLEKERKDELALVSRSYKKSNELINAKGRGTLLSQKLFAIGMQNLYIDGTGNVVATIYGKDLRRLFGSTSGSLYSHLLDLCDREKKGSTIFDWNILVKDDENKHFVARQVVTDAEFKDGVLTLRYNNSLTDKIANLKSNYTMLSLQETMSMKSLYSLRLLEILKSAYDYESAVSKNHGRFMFQYSIIEIKMALGIVSTNGNSTIRKELDKEYPDYEKIEQIVNDNGWNKYAEFKDFNKNVLKVAKKEINEKTSLLIDYDTVKRGRMAVAVRFFVEKAGTVAAAAGDGLNGKTAEEDEEDRIEEIYELAHAGFGFRLKEIREICEYGKYDTEKIKEAYHYMATYPKEIENPLAFWRAAIKNGYQRGRKKAEIDATWTERDAYGPKLKVVG